MPLSTDVKPKSSSEKKSLSQKSSSESLDVLKGSGHPSKGKTRDSSPNTSTDGSDTESNRSYELGPRSTEHQRDASDIIQQAASKTDKIPAILDDPNLYISKLKNTENVYTKSFNQPLKDLKVEFTASDRSDLPPEKRREQDKLLKQLNTMLEEDPNHSMSSIPKELKDNFVVAQFRGIYYQKEAFPTQEARANHRNADERAEPIFASAAYKEADIKREDVNRALAHKDDPAEKEYLDECKKSLNDASKRIKEALIQLREPVDEKALNEIVKGLTGKPENLKPEHHGDIFTHLYSSNMDLFMKKWEEANQRRTDQATPEPLDKIYPLSDKATGANPVVSTGNRPTHAGAYASGTKTYEGHEENTIEPNYAQNGSRKHPYSGKTYVSLHPLEDYDNKTGPTDVVARNNRKRTNVPIVVAHEHEAAFLGSIPEDRTINTINFKYPDFSKDYKPVFEKTYGLKEDLFKAFKEAYQKAPEEGNQKKLVNAVLSIHLTSHINLRLYESARKEANARDAALIFRTGPHSFGFEPQQVLRNMSDRTTLVRQEQQAERKRTATREARDRRSSPDLESSQNPKKTRATSPMDTNEDL